MSRSNLLRKISKITGLSASQFIRQVRLENAMELLKDGSWNVSEVSFKVGFNSTSYFIKCFREHFGYPPGEIGRKEVVSSSPNTGQSERGHQLAAIMFTDIQGYTALMQQDEAKAVELRERHREIFNIVTGKYKGRILQYYGDGTLSTFPSAIDAVRCGIELQLAFRQEPQIPVRIGIHTGDIIFTEDDIIGDGVNIASRIESLALVGSVFISDKVYDEVKNQAGIQTVSMGPFELKNVGKPIEVFAIANPGLVVPRRNQLTGKGKRAKGVKGRTAIFISAFSLAMIIVVAYLAYKPGIFSWKHTPAMTGDTHEKSIAVLPFINDSDDSSNIYIINGLMESILNNLQKIEDLKVVSRTSVERYRNNPRMAPEIAKELNVNYLIEGSGQKLGDQIQLSIQLIEAQTDRHLWSGQYHSNTQDIFQLQQDVAKQIALEIRVIITPEEEAQIDKVPTENMVAYDFFLKGQEEFHRGTREGLEKAIPLFKKALAYDSTFAQAYADIAISYYYLDIFKAEKQFSREVSYYADRAYLFDPKLTQSLMAKALSYITIEAYKEAVPFLEKALEYNPNSAAVISLLSELYTSYMPNSGKYLEYALRGIRLDIGAYDSATASIIYLHVSNAFVQTGFMEEAELYINKSLEYDPENLYSAYVKPYILYAKDRDLNKLKGSLLKVLNRDTSRLDVLQEVGKVYYYQGNYDSAYHYYHKFIELKELLDMDIFRHENAKIGVVLANVGLKEESDRYFQDYREFAESDRSIYRHYHLAMYFSYMNEKEDALEHLGHFSQQRDIQYWMLLFTGIDPLVDNIKEMPEYHKAFRKIETNFWDYHAEIKASLEKKGLL
jgi:class 3 adenylate cyclase/TolB-like protein/tetratricopeptide (TPR) repeat protein